MGEWGAEVSVDQRPVLNPLGNPSNPPSWGSVWRRCLFTSTEVLFSGYLVSRKGIWARNEMQEGWWKGQHRGGGRAHRTRR